MFNLIGFSEIIVILTIALIILGPKQIPSIAKNLGKLIAKIKHFSYYFQNNFSNYLNDDDDLKSLTKSSHELKKEVANNFKEIKSNIQENNIDKINKNINQNLYHYSFTRKSLYLQSLQQRKNLNRKIIYNNVNKRIK